VTLDPVALATTAAPAPKDTTPATTAAMTMVGSCLEIFTELPFARADCLPTSVRM
jgi:hypothetical protein